MQLCQLKNWIRWHHRNVASMPCSYWNVIDYYHRYIIYVYICICHGKLYICIARMHQLSGLKVGSSSRWCRCFWMFINYVISWECIRKPLIDFKVPTFRQSDIIKHELSNTQLRLAICRYNHTVNSEQWVHTAPNPFKLMYTYCSQRVVVCCIVVGFYWHIGTWLTHCKFLLTFELFILEHRMLFHFWNGMLLWSVI